MTIYVLFKTSPDTVSLSSRSIRYKFDDDLWQPVEKCSKMYDVAYTPHVFLKLYPDQKHLVISWQTEVFVQPIVLLCELTVVFVTHITQLSVGLHNHWLWSGNKHLFVPNNKQHLHYYNHHQFSCYLIKMDNFITRISVQNGTVVKIKNYY